MIFAKYFCENGHESNFRQNYNNFGSTLPHPTTHIIGVLNSLWTYSDYIFLRISGRGGGGPGVTC